MIDQAPRLDGTDNPQPGVTLVVEAVLFDMDGTLIDSTAVSEDVWSELAAEYGLPTAEVLAYQAGRPARDTVARFIPAGVDQEPALEYLNHQELVRVDGIVEIPGANRLLGALAGAPTAIVTSATRELAARRLAAGGIEVPGTLVTSDDIRAGKPDPAGYLEAARRLGVDPARCVVFEDAEAGIQAGLASGASVVVVGDFESEATRGLPRVPDLRAVTAVVSSARIQLQLSAPVA